MWLVMLENYVVGFAFGEFGTVVSLLLSQSLLLFVIASARREKVHAESLFVYR